VYLEAGFDILGVMIKFCLTWNRIWLMLIMSILRIRHLQPGFGIPKKMNRERGL